MTDLNELAAELGLHPVEFAAIGADFLDYGVTTRTVTGADLRWPLAIAVVQEIFSGDGHRVQSKLAALSGSPPR